MCITCKYALMASPPGGSNQAALANRARQPRGGGVYSSTLGRRVPIRRRRRAGVLPLPLVPVLGNQSTRERRLARAPRAVHASHVQAPTCREGFGIHRPGPAGEKPPAASDRQEASARPWSRQADQVAGGYAAPGAAAEAWSGRARGTTSLRVP